MSKRSLFATTLFLLFAFALAACNRNYSAAPQATPTLLPPEFSVPLSNDPMALVAATATAMASGEFSTTPSLPGVETPTPVEIFTTPSETPAAGETETPTPPFIIITPGTETTPTTTLPTIPPIAFTPGSIPTVYTLQPGEFPYCIARRFNVDPQELLQLNGLSDGMIYQPGLQLHIPQTGNPFPGERALKPHPATYTVAKADMTIYAVACEFGDVYPEAIAAVNDLPLSATLTSGQVLDIP
ncbi:MAG: LysM peptidoglycan-binding domain-containing protein [Anaerolineales bacterium]